MTGDFLALCQQNGLLGDPQFSSLGPVSNPTFDNVSEESWGLAEKVTERVIESIQPTSVSEKRRHDVIDYVQNLIIKYIDCEVLSFGSVPLKTYLPDGDIDLTAIGMVHSEDALASNVRHVLEMEEKNNDAEFELKDVQYINAEVKLVKCIVQNIVVDISFNQIGGLSTLCFLEHVDRLIGKDHLFKRSVILIKAWCYYESRILGAHHGLISTYGLETMVLYIFHLFHSSLNGPLAVLYKFLDYYSNFDWDTFAVSLYGPVFLSSLPDLMVDVSENNEGDTLFTREALKNCVEQFSDNLRVSDNPTKFFPKKHLNIVDPLKDNNNLGRSVGKGNFFRIRSAFGYGARKLGRLLLSPAECIEAEVNAYFVNTLERHGNGERPDVYNNINKVAYKSSVVKSEPSEELCESINSLRVSSSLTESKATSPTQVKFSPFPHMMINPEIGHQKAKNESSSCSSNTSKLADLTGDFELHNSNLSRVRYTQECLMANIYSVYPRSPVYQYHNSNNTWDQHVWRGRYPHMSNSRVAQQFSPFTSNGYRREDLPKPRGTGTYFPNTNYNAYKDQSSPGRKKNSSNHFSRSRDNNTLERNPPQESSFEEKGSDMSLQLQLPAVARNVQENTTNSPRPVLKEASASNAAAVTTNNKDIRAEAEVKFGSLGSVLVEGASSQSLERGRRSFDSVSPRLQGSPFFDRSRRSFDSVNSNVQAASMAALQRTASNNERSAQIYRLKDEGDFPPLNG